MIHCKWNGHPFIVLLMHSQCLYMISWRFFYMICSSRLRLVTVISSKISLILFQSTFKTWWSLLSLQKVMMRRITMSTGMDLWVEVSQNILINKLHHFRLNFQLELIYPLVLGLVRIIFQKIAVWFFVCISCF